MTIENPFAFISKTAEDEVTQEEKRRSHVFGLERSLGCYKHARPDSVNGTAKGSKCLFGAHRSLWTCLRRLRKQRGIEHGTVIAWAI